MVTELGSMNFSIKIKEAATNPSDLAEAMVIPKDMIEVRVKDAGLCIIFLSNLKWQ